MHFQASLCFSLCIILAFINCLMLIDAFNFDVHCAFKVFGIDEKVNLSGMRIRVKAQGSDFFTVGH